MESMTKISLEWLNWFSAAISQALSNVSSTVNSSLPNTVNLNIASIWRIKDFIKLSFCDVIFVVPQNLINAIWPPLIQNQLVFWKTVFEIGQRVTNFPPVNKSDRPQNTPKLGCSNSFLLDHLAEPWIPVYLPVCRRFGMPSQVKVLICNPFESCVLRLDFFLNRNRELFYLKTLVKHTYLLT